MNNDKEEYLDCSNNMRHYGNHQAALITVFVTLNGAIASLVFRAGELTDFYARFGAKCIALLVSVLFAIKIKSAIMMWDHFLKRAIELEAKLDMKQYSTLPGYPSFRIRPAKWAIQILLSLTIVLWLVALMKGW